MTLIELICNECGATFFRSKRHVRPDCKTHYCGKSCHNEWNRKNPLFNRHAGGLAYAKSKENVERLAAYHKDKHFCPYKLFMRRAKTHRNQKSCTISKVDLIELWNKQGGKCPFTGWDLELPTKNSGKLIKHASLDRIDSNIGYEKGNLQFVSVMINLAKNDFTQEDLLIFCNAIKDNLTKVP